MGQVGPRSRQALVQLVHQLTVADVTGEGKVGAWA